MSKYRIEVVPQMEDLMPLIKERLTAGQDVRFSSSGDSMLPMLRQGKDSVVLSPVSGKLKKYDIALYQRDNGKYVLHRVISVEDTYTCAGDNQFAVEKGVRHDKMIAVVTAFYRGEKLHSVDDPGYQLFCRFWNCSRPFRHFAYRAIRCLRRHIKNQ